MTPARALVVMGVAGSGKSQLARAVAERTGAAFVEGDDLHPPRNIAKMTAGIPLDDADRADWLASIGSAMADAVARGRHVVATCSALKRRYRDRLRLDVAELSFVYLRIDLVNAAARVAGRPGHFMPAHLVASQFESLESPDTEPGVLDLDATRPPDELADAVVTWWRACDATAPPEPPPR